MSIDDIRADFALLDDWEDRYRYVIELGKALPPLAEASRTEANKVRGCASQVWLVTSERTGADGNPLLEFAGDSDAYIVRGLVAIMLQLFSGRSPASILATDADAVLQELGLVGNLSPQRSNGLASMVRRIRADAEAHAAVR